MHSTMIAAISTDGFITNKQTDGSWISKEDAVYLRTVIASHDILVMGSTTFTAHKQSFKPNSTKQRIVLTRAPQIYARYTDLATFTNKSMKSILSGLSDTSNKVLILGGSRLYTDCLVQDLCDKIIVTTEPVMLGSGTPFVQTSTPLASLLQNYKLTHTKQLNNLGTIVKTYTKN